MSKIVEGRTAETPTEARQAEPGPSVLLLLGSSLALALIAMAAVWLLFFKTGSHFIKPAGIHDWQVDSRRRRMARKARVAIGRGHQIAAFRSAAGP